MGVGVMSPANENLPEYPDLSELASSMSLRSISLPSLPMTLSHALSGLARLKRCDSKARVARSCEWMA